MIVGIHGPDVAQDTHCALAWCTTMEALIEHRLIIDAYIKDDDNPSEICLHEV